MFFECFLSIFKKKKVYWKPIIILLMTDVVKLKTVCVDMKKLSDVVDNEVLKNLKFNSLKTKINNLDMKIPDATI